VKSQFNQCLILAKLADTFSLNSLLYKEVGDCFSVFVPLRSSPVEIASFPLGYRICVGKTLLLYDRRKKKGASIQDPQDVFEVLRYFGRKVAEKVPGRKGCVLAEFVELVKELKVYDNMVWTHPLKPAFTELLGKPNAMADAVKVESDSPATLCFMIKKKKVEELYFTLCPEVLELLQPLKKFYESVMEKILSTFEYNRRILDRIRDLTIPWKVAKTVKSF